MLTIIFTTGFTINTHNTQNINKVRCSYNKPKVKKIKKPKEPTEEELRQRELEVWSNKLGFKVTDITPMTFKATAYSDLPEENGGYDVTCYGEPLKGNIVANNTLPRGTKLYLNGNIYTVNDKGSDRFCNPNRIDVLFESRDGESKESIRKRVSDYGVKYIEGFIIN